MDPTYSRRVFLLHRLGQGVTGPWSDPSSAEAPVVEHRDPFSSDSEARLATSLQDPVGELVPGASVVPAVKRQDPSSWVPGGQASGNHMLCSRPVI